MKARGFHAPLTHHLYQESKSCNRPKKMLIWCTLPAHNKSDGFMLTSSCGQTALAIARLKAWPDQLRFGGPKIDENCAGWP